MIKTLHLFLILIVCVEAVNSQEDNTITTKTKAIIQTEAITILKLYESTINSIGKVASKNHEDAKSHVENLIALFLNRQVTIHNDLDPKNSLSKIYEAETYANNILLWYKKGIKIELLYSNAKVGNIEKHSNQVYTIDISIPKKTEGIYLDSIPNTCIDNLDFSIAFTLTENTKISEMKIARIKKTDQKKTIEAELLDAIDSEEFPDEDLQKIQAHITSLLNDYQNYLTMIASEEESDDDIKFYRERFLSIFKNENTNVFNDLPSTTDTKQITIKQYVDFYFMLFNHKNTSISFDLENATFGKIKATKNAYKTFVYITKHIESNAQNEKNSQMLIVEVEFEKNKNNYTNFKINNIASKQTTSISNTNTQSIKTISRKGFAYEITIGSGMHSILSSDLSNISTNEGNCWQRQDNYSSINTLAGIAFYFHEKAGIVSGISFSKYNSTYNISGTYINRQETYISSTNDICYHAVEATYDSTIYSTAISIPLELIVHSSRLSIWGIYAKMGTELIIPIQLAYNATGTLKKYGFIAEIREGTTLETPIIEGTYSNGFIREGTSSGNIDNFNISIMLNATIGMEYFINYNTSLTAGFYFAHGLNDIEKSKENSMTIFTTTKKHEKTFLRKQGIFFGLRYVL